MIFPHHYLIYPRELVSAGKFPSGYVCGTHIFLQDYMGRLRIHTEIKLCTWHHISLTCKDKQTNTQRYPAHYVSFYRALYLSFYLPSMLPPMIYNSFSFWGILGSILTAKAKFVSGPRATRDTFYMNKTQLTTRGQKRMVKYTRVPVPKV